MIAIAKLTIGEAARRRVLWVLVVLAALAVGLTAWGVSALVESARDGGVSELDIKFAVSQILIFIAFMFGFVLVMTAAFFGSPAIAADLESAHIYRASRIAIPVGDVHPEIRAGHCGLFG